MVNIYYFNLSVLQERIIRLLYVMAGRKLNIHEISKHLGVSQPGVAKALNLLGKKGLIIVEKSKESGRWSIELNRENRKVIGLKRADNLKQLYESGFIDYIYNNFPEGNIILFGSYAFGEDTINSDIDIAIFGSKEKEIDSKFEKALGRKINFNFYKDFNIDKNLLANILNGITLKGSVEL